MAPALLPVILTLNFRVHGVGWTAAALGCAADFQDFGVSKIESVLEAKTQS